jgi:hypothetical protein
MLADNHKIVGEIVSVRDCEVVMESRNSSPLPVAKLSGSNRPQDQTVR